MTTGGATRTLIATIMDALTGRRLAAPWSLRYSLAAALFAVGFALRLILIPADGGYPFLTFYSAVIIAAMVCGTGPAILTATLGAAAAEYYFIPPLHSLAIGHAGIVPFSVFCVSASLICLLAKLQESAALQLRESDERYRGILEDQSETICRYLRDGTLIYVNDAFCRLAGRPSHELLGTHGI